MKKRLQNLITSIAGGLLMLIGIMMFFADSFIKDLQFSIMESVSVLVLGWVFLMAKDDLIEGLFGGIFKFKKKD